MKKILGMGTLMIVLLATVGGGTWAWFQDTETSADNSLTAGTLDLNVNGGNTAAATFTLANLAPGDNGTAYGALANVGSLEGELDMSLTNVVNVGGSGDTEFEDGSGNLGAYVYTAFFIDVDQSGDWNTGDVGLDHLGNTYSYPSGPYYDKLTWYGGENWEAVLTMAAGATDDLAMMWKIAPGVGNEIQGDSITFDLGFVLEQAGVD